MISENIDYAKTFYKAYDKLDKFKGSMAAKMMYKVCVFDVKARQIFLLSYLFTGFGRN